MTSSQHRVTHSLLAIISTGAIMMTASTHASSAKQLSIIPRPNSMTARTGAFTVTPQTKLLYTGTQAKGVAEYLSERISVPMGVTLKPTAHENGKIPGNSLLIVSDGGQGKSESEAYTLSVTPESIVIRAPAHAGLIHGTQSLLQLLPPEIFSGRKHDRVSWRVPCVEIDDKPSLPWRGYMLDVSRHFFSKETVLRQIDLLALYKINRFHLHLTDDQGWRVEIKKYPKLTTVGAWRNEGGERYGGFYTQDDLKEIVAYATARGVMIIPEIDMPGHSVAAIAAYPELSCKQQSVSVRSKAGVSPHNICPSREENYAFIGDVLDEIANIFPCPYIHIGGDEASKAHWKTCNSCKAKAKQQKTDINGLQGYFVGRVNTMIRQRGKTMIGWDEILDHGGAGKIDGAVVQSWRSSYPGLKAAERRHNAILSPGVYTYLDYPNGRRKIEGIYQMVIPDRYWSGHFSANKVLGVEAPLWTETVKNQDMVDYMTWPRMLALAEMGWTQIDLRSYDEFRARLKANEQILDQLGVNYQRIDGDRLACRWRPEDVPENQTLAYDITGALDKPGKWRLAFVWDGGTGLETSGIEIEQAGKVICRSDVKTTVGWRDTNPVLILDIVDLQPELKQTLRIMLRRPAEMKGKALGSVGAIWLTPVPQ
jgi:hexosaminidase